MLDEDAIHQPHCIVHGRTDTCGPAYFTTIPFYATSTPTFPFLCYGAHDLFETFLPFSCLLIFHMDKAQEEDRKLDSRGLFYSRGLFGAFIGRPIATNSRNYDFGDESVT